MSDLISREDAIEAVALAICKDEDEIDALKALPSADVEPKWNCTANFVAEQLERLRNMTDEERWNFFIKFFSPSADAVHGEWIPCSERLPLVGGEFLVTLVDNDGTWVSTAQWNMTFGGRWQDIFPDDGYRDISNVIAWKTLPIPYREDGEA